MGGRPGRAVVAIATAVVLTTSCGSDQYADQPGDPEVHERIAGLEDCTQLQEEFDAATADNGRAEPFSADADAAAAYMKTADERMRELDCY